MVPSVAAPITNVANDIAMLIAGYVLTLCEGASIISKSILAFSWTEFFEGGRLKSIPSSSLVSALRL